MRERRARRTPEEKAELRAKRDARAERAEGRLAIPVIIAAAVAVPAVFLSVMTEGTSAQVGTVLNWASLAVLTGESVVLFLLTGHRLGWLWRHKWKLLILAIAIPAVIFTIAPAQTLRLVARAVQFFGALRVLRAGRIIKAGRVLARRIGWTGPRRYIPILIGSVIAAGFVAVVLSDPSSTTRRLLDDELGGWPRVVAVLLAGAILAVATFVVLRYRKHGAVIRTRTGEVGEVGKTEKSDKSDKADGKPSGRAGGAYYLGEVVGGGPGERSGGRLHHHPDQ